MRILLVEDDKRLCYALAFQLEGEGFNVDTCEDGEDALYYLEEDAYDLILLDRMLPHIDGITLLKKFRQNGHSTPVIILTALGELQDKITGLDSGADDYLVKPFEFTELMARIRCMQRRPRRWDGNQELSFSDIVYKTGEHTLVGKDGHCSLSKREGDLLEFLVRNQGQLLPRATLLSKVWGPDSEVEDGNLDNYIHFLRRRLKSVGSTVNLKTVRGIGYCLQFDSLND